jgi:uncharacterized membrane protein
VTQQRFQLVVAGVLLAGVATAGSLIVLGFAASLLVGWNGSLTGAAAIPTAPTDFGDLPARLAILQPLAITQLGLLVLIATPVVRVAISVVGFALEGDRLYVAITAAVLTILLLSLFFFR